ncbi:MAG: DUF599 domain-containing protein [Hyphomicrobiaceae bacterium]|nr:DUF599 domain-containing protein [Hyphomicrobiaceae bacterium]
MMLGASAPEIFPLLLTTPDIIALVWCFSLVAAYEFFSARGSLAKRSLSASVQSYRTAWLTNMVARDQRHFDAILLSNLSQSNAFFASTSVLGIGGLAAVMSSGDAARELLQRLPMVATTSMAMFEIKILLLISILVYAFFKFAWAFRLSHYTAIMFGAMPAHGDADTASREHYAQQTAKMLQLVGNHANSGLRSFYYEFAAISWLFHPYLFMAMIALIVAVLIRREFLSHAAAILAATQPPRPQE